MKLNGKKVNLTELEAAFHAAGIAVHGLGRGGDELFTFNAQGAFTELPAACAAILETYTMTPAPPSALEALTTRVTTLETRVAALEARP